MHPAYSLSDGLHLTRGLTTVTIDVVLNTGVKPSVKTRKNLLTVKALRETVEALGRELEKVSEYARKLEKKLSEVEPPARPHAGANLCDGPCPFCNPGGD